MRNRPDIPKITAEAYEGAYAYRPKVLATLKR